MIVFYLLIVLLMVLGIRFSSKGFHAGYIDKEQCNAIKGVFILVVFLRHIYPYLRDSGFSFGSWADQSFLIIDKHIGQLLVAMFMFYSGYGVSESVKKKGDGYIGTFPKHRLLTTLLNFDVAVCGFILLDVLLGRSLSLSQIGLSLLGWESVGNSNWYIFVILLCYGLTYVAFRLRPEWGRSLVLVLAVVAMLLLSFFKQSWWYNTILCYPAGMFFSAFRQQWDTLLKKSYVVPQLVCFSIFLLFHLAGFPRLHGLSYNIESIVFALLVVMLTMKVRIQNNTLCWFGVNLFPLYIYQRMPMFAIQQIAGDDWLATHPYIYVVICLIITCAVAYCYKYWRIKLN